MFAAMGLQRFDRMLIWLGVAAALCALFSAVAIVAAITIIGIPVALAMAAAPAFFTFLLTARLVSIVMPAQLRWLTSAIAAAGILAAPAYLANQRLDAETNALVAADHNDLVLPLRPTTLAVRSANLAHFRRDETQCDDFCLRALLTGAAERVIAGGFDPASPDIDAGAAGRGFRLERRETCPQVNLRDGQTKVGVEVEKATAKGRPASAAEVMRIEIAGGNCLIDEPASIGSADVVITVGMIRKGANPYGAGLDVFADTISADRITVHQRSGKAFAEMFRETGVSVHRHLPILLPTYVTGYGFEIGMGFQRIIKRINMQQYQERPDWTGFLTTTLGLDLAVAGRTGPDRSLEVLAAKLAQDGPLDPVIGELAADFFAAMLARNAVTQPEAELGLAVLRDRRLRVPRDVWVLVRKADAIDETTRIAITSALFERLREAEIKTIGRDEQAIGEEASLLGTAIGHLPDRLVQPHRAELEALARDTYRRVPAYAALKKLPAFGADALPTLIYLIDDAEAQGRGAGNNWQHPYLAGIGGICQMGATAGGAIGPLLERLDRGRLPIHASYGNQLISTFATIGADVETVWSHLAAAGYKEERKRFDNAWQRALRKQDCSY